MRTHHLLATIVACGAVAVAVVLLSDGHGSSLAATGGRPAPVRYELELDWRPSTRTLTGTEVVRLRNDGPGSLRLVWLRLWANSAVPGDAYGCRSPNIELTKVEGAEVSRYSVACSAVALRLPERLESGAEAEISLRFRIDAPSYSALFGRSAGADLFGRVVPVLAVRDEAGWHLDPDTAIGDPAYTRTASWHATLEVPAGLSVAATGRTLGKRAVGGRRVVTTWAPRARDFAFALGRLATVSSQAAGTRLRVFYSSRIGSEAAAAALRRARRAFATYSDWYGPAGIEELDLVLVDLDVDSQELPEIVFTDPRRAFVAHEVAHMWFYGLIGNDQYREPWLDESFASWNEEQLAPGSYRCDVRRPLRNHRGGLARGLDYYERRPGEYGDVIYRGGSCALEALARELGRVRFLALLREEATRYGHGVIDSEGFLELVRAVDAGVAERWRKLVGL